MSEEELKRKAQLYFVLHGSDPQAMSKKCFKVCRFCEECKKIEGWCNRYVMAFAGPTDLVRKLFCVKWLDKG